jgi:hypothetical protein
MVSQALSQSYLTSPLTIPLTKSDECKGMPIDIKKKGSKDHLPSTTEGSPTKTSRRPRCMYRLPSRLLDAFDTCEEDTSVPCICNQGDIGCISDYCLNTATLLQLRPRDFVTLSDETLSQSSHSSKGESDNDAKPSLEVVQTGQTETTGKPSRRKRHRPPRRQTAPPLTADSAHLACSSSQSSLSTSTFNGSNTSLRSENSSTDLTMYSTAANGAPPLSSHSRHSSNHRLSLSSDRRSLSNGSLGTLSPTIAVNGGAHALSNGAMPVPNSQQNAQLPTTPGLGLGGMSNFDGPRSPPSSRSKLILPCLYFDGFVLACTDFGIFRSLTRAMQILSTGSLSSWQSLPFSTFERCSTRSNAVQVFREGPSCFLCCVVDLQHYPSFHRSIATSS